MTHPSARPKELATESRRRQVAAMLQAGVTDQWTIAGEVGVHQSTISRDVRVVERWWREQAAADVAAAKGKDLQRIERAVAAVWPAVRKGDVSAVNALVRLLERRASMYGYDAPQKVDMSGDYTGRIEIVGVAGEDI